MKNKIALLITSSAMLGSLLMAGTAFAQTTPPPTTHQGFGGRTGHAPGVFGTVTVNDGSTLTVTSKGFGPNATATTYTVTTGGATVTKNGASSSVGDIAVGDTVMVAGTISGTSVTATTIRDGMPQGQARGTWQGHASSTLPQGNGEPVVGGTVTAVDTGNNTLTITNASNVTYAVDATGATVTVKGTSSAVGSIAIGDNVLVQGTVNGNAVTASSVIDQGAPKTATSGTVQNHAGSMGGILGGIGGFFHHLLGFF